MSKPIFIISVRKMQIAADYNKHLRSLSEDGLLKEYYVIVDVNYDQPKYQMFNHEGQLTPKQAEALDELKKVLEYQPPSILLDDQCTALSEDDTLKVTVSGGLDALQAVSDTIQDDEGFAGALRRNMDLE